MVYTLPTRTLHPVEPGTGDDMKTATMHATIGYADDAADPVEGKTFPHYINYKHVLFGNIPTLFCQSI